MNAKAVETFSTTGVMILCLALGIILVIATLALFFTALGRLTGDGAKPETIAVRGVLRKDTWSTVHLQGGETFERVRFIGFTSTDSVKTHLPYDLNGMVILEEPGGRRFLVRAKVIRMIVIAPTAGPGPASGSGDV